MIVGYIGGIGTGKTMNVVRDAVEQARQDHCVIVSNIRIRAHIDPERGVRDVIQLPVGHDGIDLAQLRRVIDDATACGVCAGLDEFGDVIHGGKGCDQWGVIVVLDEVGILMPARFWQDMPIDLIFELSQSRKSGVDFYYTAQDVEQVDAILRRLTQHVFLWKAFPVPTNARARRGKRPWFFLRTKWKVKSIEGHNRPPLGRSIRLYRRSWERAYSTRELVRPPEKLRQRKRRDPAADFSV